MGFPRAASSWRLTALLAAALTVLYVTLAMLHARVVNVDSSRHDQSTYIDSARALLASSYRAPTNRVQMPAYVYLQAVFFDPSSSDAEAFERGKLVNIALSVVLLGALYAFFRRTLPHNEARVITLAAAFTVFVFRAGYVQAELLFYACSFFGFVALCRLWEKPGPLAAVVAGITEAAAYLTKASVPPGLFLFGGLFLLRELWFVRRARLRTAMKDLASLALLPLSFALPLLPYLRTSKELYGESFHDLNGTYVVWFDSWDAFVARERVLGIWSGWHELPAALEPTHSGLGYWRTHSLLEIASREVLGLGEVLGNVLLGHGYAEFVAIYLVFLAVASGLFRAPLRALRDLDPYSAPAFAIPFVVLYLLLFGFYAPIAAGNRLVLMLYLPVLYSLLRHGAAREPTARVFGRSVAWRELNALVLLLLGLHVVFVLPWTITRIYAGG